MTYFHQMKDSVKPGLEHILVGFVAENFWDYSDPVPELFWELHSWTLSNKKIGAEERV